MVNAHSAASGPDPARVTNLDDLAREFDMLRSRAARGTRSARVSLEDLASRVGEPRSTIHAYLTGKRLAPSEVLDRMVIALGATSAEQREWAEAWYRVTAYRDAAHRGIAARPVPVSTAGCLNMPRESVQRQLPPTVDNFTGRAEQLRQLDADLARSQSGMLSAVSGTAGAGKTALAVQWAQMRRGSFPDGQLYVDLRGFDPERPLLPGQALGQFLRALGVAGADIADDIAERAAQYRSLLSGRRMLILLDNARDVEQVRVLLPGTPSCSVLVTSRDNLIGLIARHGAHRIEVDVLPLEDSIELLRALIGPRLDGPEQSPAGGDAVEHDAVEHDVVEPHAVEHDAVEPHAMSAVELHAMSATEQDPDAAMLAEHCARLPLALRIAAELAVSRTGAPLAELVADLASGESRLDLLEAGDDPRTAIRAVLSWSYLGLPVDAADTFRLLGLHPGADLQPSALSALADTNVAQAQRILGLLARANMVRQGPSGRYRMHGLLHAYASELAVRHDAAPYRSASLGRLSDHYLHTAAQAMDVLFPTRRHRRPELPPARVSTVALTGVAAARVWLDAERANLVAVTGQAAGGGRPLQALQLAQTVAHDLDSGAHHAQAMIVHRSALAAARQLDDRAAEAVALDSLGIAALRLRQPDGIDHLQQALSIYRQLGDRIGQVRVLRNLEAGSRAIEPLPGAPRPAATSMFSGGTRREVEMLRLL